MHQSHRILRPGRGPGTPARCQRVGCARIIGSRPRGSGGTADALGLGPCAREGVGVRVPPSAPDPGAPGRGALSVLPGAFAAQELELLDDVDELELEPPPRLPLSSEELELLLEELLLLPVELELLLEELESEELEALLDELEDAAELTGSAPVGLPPPQAESVPTPSRAAPPESRIKNSRRSDVDASRPDRLFVGSSSSKLMGFSLAWVYVRFDRETRAPRTGRVRGAPREGRTALRPGSTSRYGE